MEHTYTNQIIGQFFEILNVYTILLYRGNGWQLLRCYFNLVNIFLLELNIDKEFRISLSKVFATYLVVYCAI